MIFCIICNLYSTTSENRAITIDGNLSDWSNDELIYDDSQNDSPWGLQNELHKLYLTWDNGYLYIGVSGLQKDGNNLIVYIDTSPLTGISDASLLKEPGNPSQMWWWRRNNKFPDGFKPDFQWHMYQMKLDISEGHGLFKLKPDYTTESMNSFSGLEQKSSGNGTAGQYAEAEIKIPWNLLFGGYTFPEGQELRLIVALTGGNDGTNVGSAHDAIPDQNSSFTEVWYEPFTFDNWITIKLDRQNGRSPIPRNLIVKDVSSNQVTLCWEKRGAIEKELSYFNIYYSKNSSFSNSQKIEKIYTTEYDISNLETNTSYYFRITAVSKSGFESGFSEAVFAKTIGPKILHTPVSNFYYPGKSIFLKYTVPSDNEFFDIISSSVSYRIKNENSWIFQKMSPVTFSDNTRGFEFSLPEDKVTTLGLDYYFIIYTTAGVKLVPYNAPANYYQIKIDSVYKGKINLNGKTEILVPDEKGGLTKLLVEPFSTYSEYDVYIEFKDISDIYLENKMKKTPGEPVAIYEIYTKDVSGGKTSFGLLKPATLTLRYFESDLPSEKDESKLVIYRWTGNGWQGLTTTVDRNYKTVTASVDHFSTFAIFYVTENQQIQEKLTLSRVVNSSFCPSLNTSIEFYLTRATREKFYLYIFDTRGNEINKIENTLEDRIFWDGRNKTGEIVEGGVYLYQLKLPDKTISGTCVVIK